MMKKKLVSTFVYASLLFISVAHSIPACAADDDTQTIAQKVESLKGFILGGDK